MNINKVLFENGDDYLRFVRQFVTLTNQKLSEAEEAILDKTRINSVADMLPGIIAMVESTGFLRGQDGFFHEIERTGESQNEFYSYEDGFLKRLDKVILAVVESEAKEFYNDKMNHFYVMSKHLDVKLF